MNTFASISEMKYRAKNHLTGKYGVAVNAMVTVQLIVTGIAMMVNVACDRTSIVGIIIYYLIQMLIMLLVALFNSGQCFLYLNMCCDRPIEPNMIYYGFKEQPEKAVLLQIYQTLLYLICSVPGLFAIILGFFMRQETILRVGGFLMLASGVAIAYLGICFSQVFYLMHDFPDTSAKDLLLMSYRIMQGYKGKMFLLILSFVPIFLAVVLSLGIGLLWVGPYFNATTTEFFLELMRKRE